MRALILMLCLLSAQAWAATRYIDPDCTAFNGDGTTQACAASGGGVGAYNTWESATTWTGNAVFLQKGGSTFTDDDGTCNYLINASGADTNNRITVGAYGTGKAAIVCTSGYVFGWASDRAFITIEDMDLTATGSNCLYPQSGNNEIIQDNIFRSCGGAGISLDGSSALYNHDNTRILRNVFMSTTSKAISAPVAVANTQNWDNIEIADNEFQSGISNNGALGPPVDFLISNGTTARVRGLSIHGNTFTDIFTGTSSSWVIRAANTPIVIPTALTATVTITNASPGVVTYTAHGLPANAGLTLTTTGALPTGLSINTWYFIVNDGNLTANTFALSATQGGAAINTSSAGSGVHTATVSQIQSCIRIPYIQGLKIYDNVVANSRGGIYASSAQDDATFGQASIYNNTLTEIFGAQAIGSFYGIGVDIYGNTINGVTPTTNNSFIDGIGINRDYCDYGANTYSNFITHVRGYEGVDNNGQALGFFFNEAQKVYGNVAIGNKDGFVPSNGGPRTVPYQVYNNTFSNNARDGIYLNFMLYPGADVYRNNVLTYNGGYGARAYSLAPTNQDMDYNDYFGNVLGARRNDGSFGIVTGANDLAVDPQFVGGATPTIAAHARLKSTSPLRRVGQDRNIGAYQDGLGRGYLHPPSIGGLEATSGDARINKTARQ